MQPHVYHDFIAVYDDALPSELCDDLVREFVACDKTFAGRVGGGVDPQKKLSTDLTLNTHPEWRSRLEQIYRISRPLVRDYLAALRFPLIGALSPTVAHPRTGQPESLTFDNWEELGLPNADALMTRLYRWGIMNIQEYEMGKGGYPHWHSEIYPQDARCEPLHRVLFFMYYLNDVAEGGETEFFYQKLSIQPRRGRCLIAPASFTHTHRGNVPVSNNKYIATSWLLFRRAEDLFRAPAPRS